MSEVRKQDDLNNARLLQSGEDSSFYFLQGHESCDPLPLQNNLFEISKGQRQWGKTFIFFSLSLSLSSKKIWQLFLLLLFFFPPPLQRNDSFNNGVIIYNSRKLLFYTYYSLWIFLLILLLWILPRVLTLLTPSFPLSCHRHSHFNYCY